MKKITWLLVLLLVCVLAVSCGPKTPGEQTPGDTPAEPGFALAFEGEKADYAIVIGEFASESMSALGKQLKTAMEELYGGKITIRSDLIKVASNDQELSSLPEILIGDVSRPEAEAVIASLEDDQYTICEKGNKLVIAGATDALTVQALRTFMQEILVDESGAPVKALTKGFSRIETYKPSYTVYQAKGADVAMLIQSSYSKDDLVVADIIATEAPYHADSTGMLDSTSAIQKALDDQRKKGGGTVYLPAGEYLVTGKITVWGGCELRGDWQDPATTDSPTYGTVILARPKPLSEAQLNQYSNDTLLFYVEANAGVVGLTIYYPEQSAKNVIPYGYAIGNSNCSPCTVRNITFINAYRGLAFGMGDGGHIGSVRIEKIRGCTLDTAIGMDTGRDVCFTTDVKLSPSYWTKASSGYACDDAAALKKYVRQNATGFLLLSLDDFHFSNITMEGFKTSIHIAQPSNNKTAFWGLFYGLTLTDCDNGIVADALNANSGAAVAHATIDADEVAIINSSLNGILKLADITLTGIGEIEAEGGRVTLDETVLADDEIDTRTYKQPAAYLYIPNLSGYSKTTKDASPVIQASLDEAAKTGGIVYIPAGIYSLHSTLTVPDGVQLRGATTICQRDAMAELYGTSLLSYMEGDAAIELGNDAGVVGMRVASAIYHPGMALKVFEQKSSVINSNIGIRGNGNGVYAINCCVSATFVGIDFYDCDNYVVKGCFGASYKTFINGGGRGGAISQCLVSPHFIGTLHYATNNRLDDMYTSNEEWRKYIVPIDNATVSAAILRDDLLRTYSTMILLEDGEDLLVSDCFDYGPASLITCVNAEATLINVSVDFTGFEHMLCISDDSRVTATNVLRSAGEALCCDEGSTLDVYNRLAIGLYYEPTFHSATDNAEPTYTETDKLMLNACESLKGTSNVTLNQNSQFIKQASASFKHAGNKSSGNTQVVLEWSFQPVDISQYMTGNGYLHLWIYVDDISNNVWTGEIELTSSGRCDVQELSWPIIVSLTKQGWNELYLPLFGAKETEATPFDPTRVNYLRIFNTVNGKYEHPTFYIDDIYICNAESDSFIQTID